MKTTQKVLGLLRLVMGWIFFWAFFDKLLGLGYGTTADQSWLAGVSPTAGFLQFGTHGPLASFYQSLAGQPLVDWLFMVGLLLIGAALILGIAVKLASWFGVLLVLLMYSALLPPTNNIFVDEHIVYALVLIIFANTNVGHYYGWGRAWEQTTLVKSNSWLK